MEQTQGNPPRKRRRWLIVAIVLVSLCSWWQWPRGDARFVGKWRVTLDNPALQIRALSDRTIVLHRNGKGETIDIQGRPNAPFAWFVQGHRYVDGTPTSNASVNTAVDRLLRRLPSWLQIVPVSTSEFRIHSVSGHTIELSSTNGFRATFTRIPE